MSFPLDALGQARRRRVEKNHAWLETAGSGAVQVLLDRVEHRWRIAAVLEATASVRGTVVELGCFTGELSRRIIAQGNKTVVGIDVMDLALQEAERYGVVPVHADIDDGIPPLPVQDVACVIAADILQHLIDPARALDEIAAILSPGRTLVVTVPNYACFNNRVRILLGHEPLRSDLAGLGGLHPSAFTVRSLRRLLNEHGFVTESITGDVLMLRRDQARVSTPLSSHRLGRAFPALSRNIIATARRQPHGGVTTLARR